MKPYRDIGRDSGVAAYDFGSDYIDVQFKNGRTYRYTYAEFGSAMIEAMKRLAIRGDGLNTYINQNIKKRR